MRARNYYLTSLEVLSNVVVHLHGIILDGKVKVTFSAAGSKSAKQRGLQWMGYEDKAKSGIGGRLSDTSENVHLVAKYRFAIPIFSRDDDYFADMYSGYRKRIKGKADEEAKMWYFVDKHVSTEDFTVSQMAEFLTHFRNDCTAKGITLREPEFKGLLEWIENQNDNERGGLR